ncbi:histone-lysine N-methyltransferase SETMAR [Plakobranchus ocellatus]|uniref:Histone-lysine N-methyltransferase SETMAR n=1 Tax=Plakobranchus ocellatus TaxID=259542 RepID=A0AAV4DP49_9GAST|nr:histone-lysine N-methyltransferase SETMAR [Plakobranchus ocellatus]
MRGAWLKSKSRPSEFFIALLCLPSAKWTKYQIQKRRKWLQRYGWEILPHPAHSPDLAPSDFHLFEPLKRHLGGMAFETKDDLISKLRNWFDNLDVDFFRANTSCGKFAASASPFSYQMVRIYSKGRYVEYDCSTNFHCSNCRGDIAVSSKSCPNILKEQAIRRYKLGMAARSGKPVRQL